MKVCHLLTFVLLSVPLAFLSSGCATTHRPEVSTYRDSHFSPTPANKIALTFRPNPSPQDAELGRLLTAEFQREDFNLVSAEQADYLLTYVVDDIAEEREWAHIHSPDLTMSKPFPAPQTTRQIIYSSEESSRLQGNSDLTATKYIFHTKGIRLYLYTNPKTHSGSFQVAWSGSITVGKSLTAEGELSLIKTLLGYFGKDQNGAVNLAQ